MLPTVLCRVKPFASSSRYNRLFYRTSAADLSLRHSEIERMDRKHILCETMTPETRRLADLLLLFTDTSSQPSEESSSKITTWQHRSALSQAITLIESRTSYKEDQAAALLTYLMRQRSSHDSFRIGIAGSPGSGKSSFIESFGKYILNLSTSRKATTDDNSSNAGTIWIPDKLAVVCIDPSSLRTGGSILGDKTRMPVLSSDPRAFVRPAPAQGILGGLAPRTDDVVRMIAQQYPVILLETVGLGQSEVEVQQSVDMLVLAVPPGGGDDLQGVKKGIVEVADMIVVTKADGDLLSTAKHTAGDYRGAMQFLGSVTAHLDDSGDCLEHSQTPTSVLLTSAVTGKGLDVVWEHICRFRRDQIESGQLQKRRQKQGRYWMWKHLQLAVQEYTAKDPALRDLADTLLQELDDGSIPPRVAATVLLQHLKR